MLYSGALTVYGRGEFIVTGTGSQTEIGKIATLLETAEDKQTPLQQNWRNSVNNWGLLS